MENELNKEQQKQEIYKRTTFSKQGSNEGKNNASTVLNAKKQSKNESNKE